MSKVTKKMPPHDGKQNLSSPLGRGGSGNFTAPDSLSEPLGRRTKGLEPDSLGSETIKKPLGR